MPERAFVTTTWTDDDWFQDLTRDLRYLFLYLWSNGHVNQAGVYPITLSTMAFESKFSKEELTDLLPKLNPKVVWYPDKNIIWVKGFLKRQGKSPKFLTAAGNCLQLLKNNGLAEEVVKFNKEKYSISIPYRYPSEGYRYGADADTDADTDTSLSLASSLSLKEIVEAYEELIGQMVTPTLSEKLKDMAQAYPKDWVLAAFKKAKEKRATNPLNYAGTVLETWHRDKTGPGKELRNGRASADKRRAIRGYTDEERKASVERVLNQ